MTEATLTPAAALAERVLEATHSAGQIDVAPGRKAAALTALDQLGYPTTRDERWKYTRVARIQQWRPKPQTVDSQFNPPEFCRRNGRAPFDLRGRMLSERENHR